MDKTLFLKKTKMAGLTKYQGSFETYLKQTVSVGSPAGLYLPIQYLLELGGKRLRPVLVLMAAEAFGNQKKEALPAALAIEIFHNFTLMHDDIMDEAPLRRGAATVHQKWNLNTAILSGDAMMIQAYQALESYKAPLFGKLTRLLSKTAIEVCEGQQYDLDFESEQEVSQEQYLEMIRLKTAVLVGCALKMGAWIGGAQDHQAQLIFDFGELLGTAFQIQDDYLDAFGDPASFGKQLGGDIIENKKTILYHQAMSKGSQEEQRNLKKWFTSQTDPAEAAQKIKAVKTLFETTGAREASRNLVGHYTQIAFEKLESLTISEQGKTLFKAFGTHLMERKF